MRVQSITCDNCGTELIVDSSYPSNYGLQLTPKNYGINTTGFTYTVVDYLPFEGKTHDFCNTDCLKEWLK